MIAVLIDTNVFLSALISNGTCRKVIDLWSENNFQLYISEEILTEMSTVGKRPGFRKYFTLTQLDRLLFIVKNNSHIIAPVKKIPKKYCSPDPKDNIFISLILHNKIDYFVTGNAKDFNTIQSMMSICSPSEFINSI